MEGGKTKEAMLKFDKLQAAKKATHPPQST